MGVLCLRTSSVWEWASWEEKGGGMAVYSKERVVAKRILIALCVSEKVAVTGPVGK